MLSVFIWKYILKNGGNKFLVYGDESAVKFGEVKRLKKETFTNHGN